MREPRELMLTADARAALAQVMAIMTDQLLAGDGGGRWDIERLMALEVRLGITVGIDDIVGASGGEATVTLGIDDAALLLDGMAFTEMASVDLPWFQMVRWTADFIAAELRPYWSDELWRSYVAATD